MRVKLSGMNSPHAKALHVWIQWIGDLQGTASETCMGKERHFPPRENTERFRAFKQLGAWGLACSTGLHFISCFIVESHIHVLLLYRVM